jgi:hypothetical protein
MIDVVADNGRALAERIVPTFGGQVFDGGREQDAILVAGYMGL